MSTLFTNTFFFLADLLARPATDRQFGNDNVSQERLDDHGEVRASVVAARLHQLAHRTLSQGKKEREGGEKNPQVFIIKYRR